MSVNVLHSWGWLVACCVLTSGGLAQSPPPGPASEGVLTNAARLRALSAQEAARQLPVRLRATVTATNPSSIFLQDNTGGTFINVQPNITTVGAGDVLEVEGVTYIGRFVTGIGAAQFRVIGHADLPVAVPVSFDDLLSARRHYERVEVCGTVHSVNRLPEFGRFVLNVAMGSRKLEVQIVVPGTTNLPPLVDAQVRLAGLAAGYINNRRQLVCPQVLVSQLEDLRVEAPPPTDPSTLPLSPARDLLRFAPEGASRHRVRVRGIVTHRQPGEALYLRDGAYGLLAETTQPDRVRPGDIVEVLGFPAMGRFSAFLEDAEFRIVGQGTPPEPLLSTLTEALTGTNEANLVTLDAKLLEVIRNPREALLVLRAGDSAFVARGAEPSLLLRKGSELRLTGVCRVDESGSPAMNFAATPRSIELLLRSPEDIVVLSTPSGWTLRRLGVVAGLLLGVALAALAWVVLLRKRVAEQAEVIREKVQRESALEERHRMAREMHDTLAQSFSGLGFQLEALKAYLPSEAEAARGQLQLAQEMVRYGQEGFRRSLMNLRSEELERGSLSEALSELAQHLTSNTGVELHCALCEPEHPLPEVVESNLLRIGQECLTNAVVHGRPKRVEVVLRSQVGVLEMRIADDGVGFDPKQQATIGKAHFGLRGVQERAEQIHARLRIDSQPGRGTLVTVTVPA
jgi:signal transduction histidine kinase